ncbi:MAG: hypothetical protein JKX94_09610 [Sneathiella sp.]|nr:hypothetical protein [Sneathiella sp.]
MNEKIKGLRTIALRPIDCSPNHIKQFINIILDGGEVPIENLKRGIPTAEMLFFTGTPGKLMGVSAVRYPNAKYSKHLFEHAGVPQMYNPLSVEVCWLCVLPEYRGKGVWGNNRKVRLDYLGNRPYHAIHRVENEEVGEPIKSLNYNQAGSDFHSDLSDDKLRLIVHNHDPVLDKSKRLQYL